MKAKVKPLAKMKMKPKPKPRAALGASKVRRLELPDELAGIGTAQAALVRVLSPYSANTQKTYRIAWLRWSRWCADHKLAPAPIDPLRLVAHLEGIAETLKPKTVRTTIAALSAIDSTARGMRGDAEATPIRAHPIVRAWIKAWARDSAGTGPRKAPPIAPADLVSILAAIERDASAEAARRDAARLAKRDRALIALGWFGALRRSELAALNIADVRSTSKGIEILIRRSKTDQEGAGATIAIYAQTRSAVCPVQAWRAWHADHCVALTNRYDNEAPAFPQISHDGSIGGRLSGAAVSDAIKRRAKAVGIAASSHSLRGGFATAAGEAGKQERDIQAHGRWKSVQVVRGYVSRGDQWNALNPTKDLTT